MTSKIGLEPRVHRENSNVQLRWARIAILASGAFAYCTPVLAGGYIHSTPFGDLPDGRPAILYKLKNSRGMEVRITNYGGIITYMSAPDRNGRYENVVLRFDSLTDYIARSPYFGAIIGRYATSKCLVLNATCM